MKKIRIGNDFVFNWAIERGGLPEDLSSVLDAKLTVSVFGKKQEVPFTVSGNIITIEFTPEICNVIGSYNLLFTYILPDLTLSDEDRKCAVDVDAFQIVAKTAQASEGTEFSVTSDMAIAFKGDKGDSAYQVWLDAGNTGTEEDYFAYLRQPAVDAAQSANEAADSALTATQEAITAASLADTARLAIQDDLALKANQTDLEQLESEVSNISNQAEAGVFHPEEFDGYVDSKTGAVVTSGNDNALFYRNTGYIRLLKGLTISVTSKGRLQHIVVFSRESQGYVIDKTTSNTYTATEDCFVRVNNDTRLNSSGISYSIHGIETLIKDIKDQIDEVKDQIDEVNIESIFGASDLSLLVGSNLGGRYGKLALKNAFQKIELYNWSGQEEIYISYYRASQTEDGTSITLQFRDLKNGNRLFARVNSVIPVDRGDGIGVTPISSYAYIRNSGGSSQQWSDVFPAGYLYVRMKYLPFLSGNWNYSTPAHNANFSTVGLRNITRITVANSVMQAQVASAQQVTVGSKTLTKRNPGWTDVNYYKLKEYDLGKLFNVSDSRRVSNYPRVIERIYPHVIEDSTIKLLLQGIVEDNFVWIDKDGKVYLSSEDSGASTADVICDGSIPNIGEDIVDYKICNVLPISPNKHILQVHAVRLVNSKYRVCAENYIYDNGIISYAFSFPYKDNTLRQDAKSIIDFRANWQFSKHGNVIVVSDYGSKSLSGTVWVSTDNGGSWKNIFRMRAQDGFPRIPDYPFINQTGESVTGNHVHATFYDPYRDSILVTTGDVPGTEENLNNKVASGIYECRNFRDDIGDIVWEYKSLETSTNYPYFNSTQLVGGVATPNCQLFGTDAGFDNGIFRLNDVGGSIENKVIDKACIVYDVEDALVTNGINNMESDTRMLSNGLIISLFQDYNSNPNLDGNGDYPSKMIASYDGYIWDKLFTFPANGEVSWMAMAQESSKYLYIRTRGVTAQSQESGLPSGTYLTDEQIERCYLIKMTKPY